MDEPPPDLRTGSRRWRLETFADALRGLKVLFTTQPNVKVHAAGSVGAVVLGFVLKLSPAEWGAIIFAITLVWITEGLNTAIEFLVDLISPDKQRLAGWAKDVAAGAVLFAALGAVGVGLVIFLPKLIP